MDKREKVIYSIERCICHVPDACRDCGYDNEPCPKCFEHLLRDAHDLLKAQEPSVLTLDELRKVELGTVLWQDIRNNPEIKDEWMPMFPVEFIGFIDFAGDETIEFSQGMDYCAEYGKSFLLWTAKPSEEQRKAVKWNDSN